MPPYPPNKNSVPHLVTFRGTLDFHPFHSTLAAAKVSTLVNINSFDTKVFPPDVEHSVIQSFYHINLGLGHTLLQVLVVASHHVFSGHVSQGTHEKH